MASLSVSRFRWDIRVTNGSEGELSFTCIVVSTVFYMYRSIVCISLMSGRRVVHCLWFFEVTLPSNTYVLLMVLILTCMFNDCYLMKEYAHYMYFSHCCYVCYVRFSLPFVNKRVNTSYSKRHRPTHHVSDAALVQVITSPRHVSVQVVSSPVQHPSKSSLRLAALVQNCEFVSFLWSSEEPSSFV